MGIFDSLTERFTAVPAPGAVFQVGSRYISGIGVAGREKRITGAFFIPLAAGVVEPHSDRLNIIKPNDLRRALDQGLGKVSPGREPAAVIIPETSAHVMAIKVDSVPAGQDELEAFVRWKMNRLVPGVSEESVVSFDCRRSGGHFRLTVAAVRRAVVREYESLFEGAGFRTGFVSVPSLGLMNGALREKGTLLLVNVEPDHLSLLLVEDSSCAFYRQKITRTADENGGGAEEDAGRIAAEIENTVRYLAERERLKVDRIRLRTVALKGAGAVKSRLAATLGVPVSGAEQEAADRLLPLMGFLG